MTPPDAGGTTGSSGEAIEDLAERASGAAERPGREKPNASRIPAGSIFYTRALPVLILAMGVVTAVLILFAAGVLFGIIPFR